MPYKIIISDDEFDALPANQRFLLEQVMERHPGPQRETPQFVARHKETEKDNESKLGAVTNSLGGIKQKFDINRRLIP